jgi:2',3'-cyclic-nucleotide 2'-phosphodiesterase (5'-nucleotidase family)
LAAQRQEPGSPRAGAPLTILQLNDVYSTVPADGSGGLARVATLKRQLVDAGRTPLLLLAGDFLSSSVASAVFQGEQMIAALNAAGVDMATLGNHEFDFGALIEPDSGPLMVTALERHISGQQIAPAVDGRILMAQ